MKKLNFGAGKDIHYCEGNDKWDNADLDNHNGANIVFDFNKFPYPIKDNTYDYVYCNHVLEHLHYTEDVLSELARITKPNGIVEVNIPHYNNEGAYTIGHIRQFNTYGFKLLCNPVGWEKEVKHRWELLELKEIPTRFGKWIYPEWLRHKLSLLLRGIYWEIRFKGRVIKNG